MEAKLVREFLLDPDLGLDAQDLGLDAHLPAELGLVYFLAVRICLATHAHAKPLRKPRRLTLHARAAAKEIGLTWQRKPLCLLQFLPHHLNGALLVSAEAPQQMPFSLTVGL